MRVLLVDDSVVTRKVVSQALASHPSIDVIGTASTGAIALSKISREHVDVVVLDVEMPDMDGPQTLAEIRKQQPSLPVVVFSAHTAKGSPVAIRMMSQGASAYALKPARVADLDDARASIVANLAPLILQCAGVPQPLIPQQPSEPGAAPPRTARAAADIVVIGSSTGGPEALTLLLESLPSSIGVPIVIAQHIPPTFSTLLAQRLAARCALPVHEVEDGMVPEPGHVYLAPGDHHVRLVRRLHEGKPRRVLALDQGPKESSCRPAVDPLFVSAAELYGSSVLAIVLTGMGQDGLRGAGAVRRSRGHVAVQDEASSVVWGMPGAVANAGQADVILPLSQIGAYLSRKVPHGRLQARSSTTAALRR